MGNTASRKQFRRLSGPPDVNVFMISDIWKYFAESKQLGKGTYGLVFSAKPKDRKSGKSVKKWMFEYDDEHESDGKEEFTLVDQEHVLEVAVKLIPKAVLGVSEEEKLAQKYEFLNEVRILQKLSKEIEQSDMPGQENVVNILASFVDKKNYILVTELCKGGELWNYILSLETGKDQDNLKKSGDSGSGRRQSAGVVSSSFSEMDASFLMKKILQGLQFCHSHNIAHLDIKPENVLLLKANDPASVKLVDFGCAKFTHDLRGKPLHYDQYFGTLFFAAPEIIGQYSMAGDGDFIKAIDMWSIGVLCFLMVTGSRPFYSEVESVVRKVIYECKYEFPQDIPLSTSVKDFIARLLVEKPKDRMTVQEALSHPWIANPEEHASKDSFDPRVFIGIQRYQKQSLFKRLVVRILCSAMTDKEQEHIQAIFSKFDKDHSGNLEISEISTILKEMFNLEPNVAEKEAKSVLQHFDSNNDGTLDWSEFARLIVQGSLVLDKSKIRQAFQIIDENADGMISPAELRKALGVGLRQSVAITESEFISMLQDLDENDDGMISFDEFQSQILK